MASGGLRLAIRLTPRANKTAFGGLVADADGRALLQVRISAAPVEGAANAALIAFLASSLGLRKSDIVILSGETSRVKLLHLAGDVVALEARLSALIGIEA